MSTYCPGTALLTCDTPNPDSTEPCIRPSVHSVGPHMDDNGARWHDDLFTTTGTTHPERNTA